MREYNKNESYIYIFYSPSDSDKVMPTIESLNDKEFRIWYTSDGTVDRRHLEECGVFLAFLSDITVKTPAFIDAIDYVIHHNKTPLVVYLDDVKMTIGMRMQLGSVQGIYRNRHSSHESFMEEICRSRVLLPCCENDSIEVKKPLDNAEIAYRRGMECVAQNLMIDAFVWFKKGADLGNSTAQYELACRYYNGKGCEKNYDKAFWWFRKAAEQGEIRAMLYIAESYLYGRGVKEDISQGIREYKKAAKLGSCDAQSKLGWLYYYGECVQQDYVESIKWYTMAAEQGDNFSKYCLGELYFYGLGAPKDYNKAFKMYSETRQNNIDSIVGLGKCYLNGYGVAKNEHEAVKLFSEAAGYNNSEALYELACCYFYGRGVQPDRSKAMDLFKRAEQNGFDTKRKPL